MIGSVRLLTFAAVALCPAAAMAQGSIVVPGSTFEVVSRAGNLFAEGVVAAKDGMVYVSDLTRTRFIKQNNPGGTIYRYNPATGETTKFMEPSGMSNGLHVDKNNDLLICQDADTGGRAVLRRNLTTGAISVVADTYQGKPFTGTNDATTDARGRIYFTDGVFAGEEERHHPNAVYRVDLDGKVTRISTDLMRPNGIEVSPDGRRLYVATSNRITARNKNPHGPNEDRFGVALGGGGVAVYDLDGNGNISNGRLVYKTEGLGVDGMAMDTEGNLYITLHNGDGDKPRGDVLVFNPAGKMVERIALPKPLVTTNVGFGRGADANSLYLTTAYPWQLLRVRTTKRGHYFE